MKKAIYFCIVFIIILLLYLSFNNYNNSEILKNSDMLKKYNNAISLMYETNVESGIYESNSTALWPTSGYVFNEMLSKCENGSTLDWDDTNKKVIISSNQNDKCYVYFDKEIPTLVNYIKGLYTTQGANNLYHHDGTLENGINDGSYRYSGAYESVNNWVCFGSTAATCPSSNLYRIIGVFNEKNVDTGATEERVKLIMNDYAGETVLGKEPDYSRSSPSGEQPMYTWSGSYSNDSNDWLTSLFNTETLNGTYLTILGSEWTNKIALTEWKVGLNEDENILEVNAATAYQNEIVSPATSTVDNKKVGLMYASDYGFAVSPANWTTILGYYNNDTNIYNNWLYRGMWEWTIMPTILLSEQEFYVFYVLSSGDLSMDYPNNAYGTRPVFYLESTVTYASGTGTQNDPIRIK